MFGMPGYEASLLYIAPLLAILIAMSIGATVGILAGYIGGPFDQLIMGLLDVMLSFPTLLLGLMIAIKYSHKSIFSLRDARKSRPRISS